MAATLVVAAIFIHSPRTRFAQIEKSGFGVDGMTCNVCAGVRLRCSL